MSDTRRWVIGDIHGCSKTLRSLIEDKIRPGKQDNLIFVGDYVDRGPDSKAVISYLMELRLLGYKVTFLKGNHEDMMFKSVHDKTIRNNWFYNGGMPTLRSFGVREPKEIPSHFLEFVDSLEYYFEMDDFLVVHAGLNFEIEDPLSDREGMLWIRNQFVMPEKIGNRTMVHGHTPMILDKIIESIESDSKDIDLDGGCVYFGTEGLGNLCALELNSKQLEVQPNIDFL